MLRLRDIMTTDVLSVSPELTVREAMDILVGRHISGAPVIANGVIMGIVSATDLLAFAASLPDVPQERTESDEWDALSDVSEWSEDDAPAAYFTDLWDNAVGEVDARFESIRASQWNVLEEHTVAEAMTAKPLCTLTPGASVEEAAEYMRSTGVHRVLVVDHGELVGIVTSMDLTRAVSEHKLTSRTYSFGNGSAFDARGWEPADRTVPSGELPDERLAVGLDEPQPE